MKTLTELYRYPYYQSREDYEKRTGKVAPKFDLNFPIKKWVAPAADLGKYSFTFVALARGADGQILEGPNRQPYLEEITISKSEALKINIPSKEDSMGVTGKPMEEVDIPLKPLAEDEFLYFLYPGVVAVKSTQEMLDEPTPFTTRHALMLAEIYKAVAQPAPKE